MGVHLQPLTQPGRSQLNGDRENSKVVDERDHRVEQHRASGARTRDVDVRDAERHSDRKRQVRKVDFVGRTVAAKVEPAQVRCAVMHVSVTQCIRRVRQDPRERDREQRESAPHLGSARGIRPRLMQHIDRREQTEQPGDHGDDPDKPASDILGGRQPRSPLGIRSQHVKPIEDQDQRHRHVPASHRTHPPQVGARGPQGHLGRRVRDPLIEHRRCEASRGGHLDMVPCRELSRGPLEGNRARGRSETLGIAGCWRHRRGYLERRRDRLGFGEGAPLRKPSDDLDLNQSLVVIQFLLAS